MTDPPAAHPRACCTSYAGYPHDPACTRKGGRTPTAAGTAPNRNIRIHDTVWDPCVAQAAADNEPVSAFVREAITRELTRRREISGATRVWAGPPDHPGRGDLPLYDGPSLVRPVDNPETRPVTFDTGAGQ